MSFSIQFVVIAALVATVLGVVDSDYNVTSGLEDYALLAGRNMQNELDIGELEIATVNARHSDRIEAVISQQQLVIQEIQQFDNNMVQRQAFSLPLKHCVQKFKSITPTLTEVNRNFTKCLYNAEIAAQGLTEKPNTHLLNARYIREYKVPNIFAGCNSTYVTQSYLEECVTSGINEQIVMFNEEMDLFQVQLLDSLYTSSIIATTANHCTFVAERIVLTSNGAVLGSTDVCEKELTSNRNAPLTLAIENQNVDESKFMRKMIFRKDLVK